MYGGSEENSLPGLETGADAPIGGRGKQCKAAREGVVAMEIAFRVWVSNEKPQE